MPFRTEDPKVLSMQEFDPEGPEPDYSIQQADLWSAG
jgi:hypothetical protein